ncbi:hypothetical protein IMAU30002_02021 [Lactobacillus helveticus]|nr:hypothetical protein [Lactobacillus helveticus]
MAKRPVILADEATSSLDEKLSSQIHDVLLNNPKITVLEVAHKISKKDREKFDRVIELEKLNKR